MNNNILNKFITDLNIEIYHLLKTTRSSLCIGYLPISKKVYNFFKTKRLNKFRFKPINHLKKNIDIGRILNERRYEEINTIVSVFDFNDNFMIKAIDSKTYDNLKSSIYFFKFRFRKEKRNILEWTMPIRQ